MYLAKHWRQKAAYYRMEGQRHRTTGEIRFPAHPATLMEKNEDWEPYTMCGRGELYSFSVLRQAPDGYDFLTPYGVGIIKLEEGPMVAAQLTDCSETELTIGQPVEMVTRLLKDTGDDGVLLYSYKFRPVLPHVQPEG